MGSPGMGRDSLITALLWLTARYQCGTAEMTIKNNKHTYKGLRGTEGDQYLLLSLHYLSRQLHFVHGLQPALHQLCGAQDKCGKGRGEGARGSVL